MNFTSKGTREILVAGCQEQMFKVDVDKGIITDAVRSGYIAARQSLTCFRFLPKPITPS